MKNETPPTFFDWLGFSKLPDFRKSKSLGALVGVIVVGVAFALGVSILILVGQFVAILAGYYEFENHAQYADAIRSFGWFLGAAFGAPFVAWRVTVAAKQVEVAEQSHITDQLTRAVEQLGATRSAKTGSEDKTEPNIEVRTGAIISLQRISEISSYDLHRVSAILRSYAFNNANAHSEEVHSLDYPDDDSDSTQWDEYQKNSENLLRSDIQLAFEILHEMHIDYSPSNCLDFRKICLKMFLIKGVNFDYARLNLADLRGAIIFESSFEHSNFASANLQGARLRRATFDGAFFCRTNFSIRTEFEGASFSRTRFRDCDLSLLTLTREQLNASFGDGSVKLPRSDTSEDHIWPPHWPTQKLNDDEYKVAYQIWVTSYTPPENTP